MSYRRLIYLALLSALPTISWAQFTTFIPPQKKLADSAKTAAVVAQEQARTDSVMRIKLTDMKAWVDSAAGTVAMTTSATDPTAAPTPVRDTSMLSVAAADSAARLRRGARAPNTASDLPMLALIGVIALAIGTVMLAGNQIGRDHA